MDLVKFTDTRINRSQRLRRSSHRVGHEAESAVISWLIDKGYVLLTRNFHCKYAEIDLIFSKGLTVAFIEVKASSERSSFPLADRLTTYKFSKIKRCAQYWLYQNPKYYSHELLIKYVYVEFSREYELSFDLRIDNSL